MVEKSFQDLSFHEHLLMRWGGPYLLIAQILAMFISDVSAIIGIYYILAATNLNQQQFIQLLIGFFLLVTLALLITSIMVHLTTTSARSRLNTIIKGKPNQAVNFPALLEKTAWHEVFILPARIVIIDAVIWLFIIILPITLFMRWIGEFEINHLFHTFIGLLISGSSVAILNSLLLEKFLIPVRKKLVTPAIIVSKPTYGSRLITRLLGLISFLMIITIIIFAGIGFQRSINASLPGANVPQEIAQFQTQTLILGIMVLILGLIMGRLMTHSISKPIQEILKTLEHSQSGDDIFRAQILSSDETAHLAFQLNKLLDKLQISRGTLEKQVEERTAALKRRTTQLQAATRVSQDTSTSQDLQTLLSRTVNLVSDYFGYYHVGIFLTDPSGEYATLYAASSEGGKKMIARGYKLEIGQRSVVSLAAFENHRHVIMDTTDDASYQENPDLPRTLSQISLPLAPRGNVIGVLDIQSSERSSFSLEDQELLQTLADQVALAIQNVQLVEENRLALEKMTIALSENTSRAWQEYRGEPKRAYRYTPTSLTLVHPPEGNQFSTSNNDFHLSIPLVLRGLLIGNIEFQRQGDHPWSESDRLLAQEVVNQISLALENARLLQDAQQRAQNEQALSELTAQLGLSVDSDTLLQTAVRELHRLADVSEVSVELTIPESKKPDGKI